MHSHYRLDGVFGPEAPVPDMELPTVIQDSHFSGMMNKVMDMLKIVISQNEKLLKENQALRQDVWEIKAQIAVENDRLSRLQSAGERNEVYLGRIGKDIEQVAVVTGAKSEPIEFRLPLKTVEEVAKLEEDLKERPSQSGAFKKHIRLACREKRGIDIMLKLLKINVLDEYTVQNRKQMEKQRRLIRDSYMFGLIRDTWECLNHGNISFDSMMAETFVMVRNRLSSQVARSRKAAPTLQSGKIKKLATHETQANIAETDSNSVYTTLS